MMSVQSLFPSAAFSSNAAAWTSNAFSCGDLLGQLKAQPGEPGAPAYSWAARSNTGMYLQSSGIAWACDGADTARMSTQGLDVYAGGLGVLGTRAPEQALHVHGPSLLAGRVHASDGLSLNDIGFSLYAAAAGSNASGGNACGGHGFDGTALRLRVPDDASNGIVFENASETCLMSVNAQTGETWIKGDLTFLSDERCKTNVRTIDRPLERVRLLSGCTFEMTGEANPKRRTGLIAQHVLRALPEAVSVSPLATPSASSPTSTLAGGPTLSVAYGNLVGLLVEAIKALDDKVERLISTDRHTAKVK